MRKESVCRGDIFYYDFGEKGGSVQSGERPVLVVQADEYNRNAPTVIVAAITGVMKKQYLPSHIVLGENFGLSKPSMVLMEQIRTINKDELSNYIGTVDDLGLLKKINIALKKTLGLWRDKKGTEKNVRCLCPKCLNDYIQNPDFIVRRLDHFAKTREQCDKCGNAGWDYVITPNKPKK